MCFEDSEMVVETRGSSGVDMGSGPSPPEVVKESPRLDTNVRLSSPIVKVVADESVD